MVKEIKTYMCTICNMVYSNKDEAKNCEDSHATIEQLSILSIRYKKENRNEEGNQVPHMIAIDYTNKLGCRDVAIYTLHSPTDGRAYLNDFDAE